MSNIVFARGLGFFASPDLSSPRLAPLGLSWLLLVSPGASSGFPLLAWLFLVSLGFSLSLLAPLLASPCFSWRHLASPGHCWLLLASPVLSWPLLASRGVSWRRQAIPGLSCALLASPVLFWPLLASLVVAYYPWLLLKARRGAREHHESPGITDG